MEIYSIDQVLEWRNRSEREKFVHGENEFRNFCLYFSVKAAYSSRCQVLGENYYEY